MRHDPTPAEQRLWNAVRSGRLGGLKFRRQEPLLGFVADFVCFKARLIVECDGWQHAGSGRDAVRDAAFAAAGFLTLRFPNEAVMEDLDAVTGKVTAAARARIGKDRGRQGR